MPSNTRCTRRPPKGRERPLVNAGRYAEVNGSAFGKMKLSLTSEGAC